MKIRELKTKDTFALARILRKLDLKQLTACLAAGSAEQVGLQVVGLLVERLDSMEADLLAFLGDLVGLSAEEFGELPLAELKDVLSQLARVPEVVGFFDSMSKTVT